MDIVVQATPIKIIFRNWRREIEVKVVIPLRIWFGSKKMDDEKAQWYIKAYDINTNEERDFEMLNVMKFLDEKDRGTETSSDNTNEVPE